MEKRKPNNRVNLTFNSALLHWKQVTLDVRQDTEDDRTRKDTSILRTACLAGAIADLAFGLLLIAFPSLSLKIYGINIELSPAVRFWMAYAGIAIFSWTAFLIWGLATTQADRNNFRTVGGYTIGNVD